MSTLRFGVAVRDITPPFPVMLHGYSARDRLSGVLPEDRVTEPIRATALWLEGVGPGGETARLVVVALDMIGVGLAEVATLRAALSGACGLAAEEILISASHTHFAPAISLQHFTPPEVGLLEPDPRFVRLVHRAVVEAAIEACAGLADGALETWRPVVSSVLFNRRTVVRSSGAARTVVTSFLYPEDPASYVFSPVDPELTLLRLVTPRGPAALLANFGCHPVTGGRDRSHFAISADYPHYFRETVERSWGCPVLFTLGGAGDVVPLERGGASRERIGGALGYAALMGERVFRSSRKGAGPATIAHRRVGLDARTIVPTRGTGAVAAYEQARAALLGVPADRRDPETLKKYNETAMRAFRARLYPEDRVNIEAAIHRIGDTVLVAMPFEVLAETALRLKQARPGAVLVSCADGYEGYLPPAYEYARGGYEATAESTHFEPGTSDRLLDLVVDELRSL